MRTTGAGGRVESLELRRLVAAAAEAQLCTLAPELAVAQLDFAALAGRIAGDVVRLMAQLGFVADIRPGSDFP